MVKEELLDILCGQKGWEEETKALLSSKKAAERELAVRVLTRWDEDGTAYKEILSKKRESKAAVGKCAECRRGRGSKMRWREEPDQDGFGKGTA